MSLDWDAAYREFHPQLIRYLTWRGADRVIAEDLAQDVFVRAMRYADKFTDDGRGLGPWLVTITRNLLLDHHKCATVRHEVLSVDVDAWEALCGPVPAAEDLAVAADEAARLRAAVRHLTPDQRQAVLLQYWSDWPQRRIGRQMYRSEGAVKVLVQRGRMQLGKIMEAA